MECSYIDVQNKSKLKKAIKNKLLVKPSFELISSSGEKISGDRLSFLGSGVNSSVWKYEKDDIEYALKIFFRNFYECALHYEVYKIVRELSFKNIVKALDIFKINDKSISDYSKYDAYLMNYLNEVKNYSILEMPVSLLVENIYNLEEDAKLLSDNNILMRDVCAENTIFSKDSSMINISDIDMFSKDNENYDILLQKNNKIILLLFREILKSSVSKEYCTYKYNKFLYNYLFPDNVLSNPTSKRIEKLFSSYDKPNDFFKDNVNIFKK